MDSIYDVYSLLSSLDVPKSSSISSIAVLTDFSNVVTNIVKTAGSRRNEFFHSMYKTLSNQEVNNDGRHRVTWVASSDMTHTFLLPSLDLEVLRCTYGNFSGKSTVATCSETGVGKLKRTTSVDEVTLYETFMSYFVTNTCLLYYFFIINTIVPVLLVFGQVGEGILSWVWMRPYG